MTLRLFGTEKIFDCLSPPCYNFFRLTEFYPTYDAREIVKSLREKALKK